MTSSPLERSQHERETLIFPTAPEAARWREHVSPKLSGKSVADQKQQAATALAEQFAAHGEAVGQIREPWSHTPAEHAEVQQLVDVAFQRDLGAAIKQARQSAHYPRNLDLLHDVLTGEMYDLLQEGQLNQQPLAGWALALLAIVGITLLVMIIVIAL